MTPGSNLGKTEATLWFLLFIPIAIFAVFMEMYFGGAPQGPQQSLPAVISTIMASSRLADTSFVAATLGVKFDGFQSRTGSKDIAGDKVPGTYRTAVGMASGNPEIEASAVTYIIFDPLPSTGKSQVELNFFIPRDCITRQYLESALGALTEVPRIDDRWAKRFGTSRSGPTTIYAGFNFDRSCLREVDLRQE